MNNKIIFLITCFSLLLKFQSIAYAANFSTTCPKANELDVGCWVEMHGQIVEGDAEKLKQIVSNRPRTSDIYRWLVLDSPGGDVQEALSLAKVVRDSMLSTQNYSAAPDARKWGEKVFVCASSCVIVAMAGVEKAFRFHKGGGIGLHRPFVNNANIQTMSPSNLAASQNQAMRVVRDYFVSERMPQRLIDEMMNRSSRDVYWVTIDDYLEIPTMSAWYEEMLIAQCQYDPSLNERWGKAILKRDQSAIGSTRAEMVRLGGCSRALIEKAQKKMQPN